MDEVVRKVEMRCGMRLIDADEHECWACTHHANGQCDTWCDYGESFELRKDVAEAKTVYAVQVVHGEWTLAFTEEENVWKCSVCDKYWLLNNGTPFDNEMNFCPKCGADMRKKVKRMIDEKKLICSNCIHYAVCKMYGNYILHYDTTGKICGYFKEDEQPKVNEWIPVEERLPEKENIMYWTTHEDGSLVMHGYSKEYGFIYNWETDFEKRKKQGDVVAWMEIVVPSTYDIRKKVE